MKVNQILAAFAVLCAAFAPAQAGKAKNPFLGSWKVNDGVVGPWFDGSGPSSAPDPQIAGHTINFTAKSASGSPVVACAKSIYTIKTVEPEYLFESSVPHPKEDAAKHGFKSEKILVLEVGCASSTGDMELSFPMVDNDTILLGLNNRVYSLKRLAPTP